jgi:hypothetical protein
MKWFKTDNEIVQFLINFFLIETLGHIAIYLFCLLLRIFGMPQLYQFMYSSPLIHHITFTIFLLIAITLSVINILKRRKQ